MFNPPKIYINTEQEGTAYVVGLMYHVLPFLLIFILAVRILESNYLAASFTAGAIIGVCISIYLFLKNHLRYSIIGLCIILILIVTGMCTSAYGIHDVAIMTFPLIIGFSSLILNNRDLTLTTAITLFSIAWLTIGDALDLYDPKKEAFADFNDFIVVSVLMIIGGVLAFSLTKQLEGAIANANLEIIKRKEQAEILEKDLIKVEEMTQEIHSNVSKSLNYVYQINTRHKFSSEIAVSSLKIARKIIAIEAAHETLHQTKKIDWVELKSYVGLLINKYKKHNAHLGNLSFELGNVLLPLDDIVAMGICLIELLEKHNCNVLSKEKIGLKVVFNGHIIQCTIYSKNTNCASIDTSEIVLNLMIKQLNAEIKNSNNDGQCKTIMAFHPTKVQTK